MTTPAAVLDSNVIYHIFYEPWASWRLCAGENYTGYLIGVTLDYLEEDCNGQWQVVNASSDTLAFRSLGYEDSPSLLALYQTAFDVRPFVITADDFDSFPLQSQWILNVSETGLFSMQNRAVGSDWFLGAATEPGGAERQTVSMGSFGIDSNAAKQWRFRSQGLISTSTAATSTVSFLTYPA